MNNFDENLIYNFVPKDLQEDALKKLHEGYPVQYILGNVDFYGLTIDIDENVLIPRFETEYLVNDTIKIIKELNLINPNVIDIGTGSGCIALSIKKNINCNIDALDISQKALEIAKKNANKYNLDINFINESIEKFNSKEKYDVIISNPPYVPFNSNVDEKIKYEPQNAIYAKDEGLYFYKIILKKAKNLLNEKSFIAFEIGDKQGNIISDIARKYFPKSNIILKKDLNGYDRYLYIVNE